MASLQARLGPCQAALQVSTAQAPLRAGKPAPGARTPRPPRPVKRYRRRPITRYPGQHRLWRRYMATQGKKRESLAVKAFKTRPEDRRVGKEYVSSCRSRGSPNHKNKKQFKSVDYTCT